MNCNLQIKKLESQEEKLQKFLQDSTLEVKLHNMKSKIIAHFILTKGKKEKFLGALQLPKTSKDNFPNLHSVPFCLETKEVISENLWSPLLSSQNGTLIYYILWNELQLKKVTISSAHKISNPLYFNWVKVKQTIPKHRLDYYLVLN